MKLFTKKILLPAAIVLSAFSAQSQIVFTVGVLGGVNYPEPLLDWNTGIERQTTSGGSETIVHFGITGKARLYEQIHFRTDIFYKDTKSSFGADYRVGQDGWTANAVLEQQTINLMFAPQIHFLPKGAAYVFGGLLIEMNRNSDFTYGQFLQPDDNGLIQVVDFKDDEAQNNNAPAAVIGLGLNPKFGRIGIFGEARYSRSKFTAVHPLLPRIGHVDDPVCLQLLRTVLDRRQVGGGVEESAVGFSNQIGLLGDGRISNHYRPLAHFCDLFVKQILNHSG